MPNRTDRKSKSGLTLTEDFSWKRLPSLGLSGRHQERRRPENGPWESDDRSENAFFVQAAPAGRIRRRIVDQCFRQLLWQDGRFAAVVAGDRKNADEVFAVKRTARAQPPACCGSEASEYADNESSARPASAELLTILHSPRLDRSPNGHLHAVCTSP